MRSLADIDTLIIHHTAGSPTGSTYAIASFHVDGRGWPGIGYHFLIGADGTIEQTNHLETVSYHASYTNDTSVGISLKGSFVGNLQPPDAQIDAVAWLVNKLKGELNIERVIGHKETDWAQQPGNGTQCPGDTWELWRGRVGA
jgi:N-acetyl-anhydromuramyl-L-alanine amidase AmpD